MFITFSTILKTCRYVILFVLSLFVIYPEANAQEAAPSPMLNVYLDCSGWCYDTYIQTNVDFVNYVRDQDDADIYLRITSASTGTGSEYVLDYRGMGALSSRRDTVIYHSHNTDSSDERRSGLVRRLALGLVPFMIDSDLLDDLTLSYEPSSGEADEPSQAEDPWNSWIFDIELGSSLSLEENESSFGLDFETSAERVTDDWKIQTDLELSPDRERIELSDGTRRVNSDQAEFNGSIVRSIGDHFAVGVFAGFEYSRRGNTTYEYQISPAFEYSVFPYEEFQERRIFIQYRLSPSFRDYDEITIFQKESETLLRQQLSVELEYDQPWGRIDVGVSGANYFHDTSINRLTIDPSLDIRITRSLSFNISSRYTVINDQISLPASDPDDIDVILGQRDQATSYDFFMSFGISYTFGSIFSGAVNPRL
ncbi:MAG: hypothetical protein WD355_03820 [Balneolaceae bacterium]